MSRVVSAEAYAFASRFSLRDVASWISTSAREVRTSKTEIYFELDEGGSVYAFDFGALVFFNVVDKKREALVRVLDAHLKNEPHPPLRESVLVEIRPSAPIEVTFDRVVVPDINATSSAVIATVLAQSVCIDYYDEDVQGILKRIGTIAGEVAQRGKPAGNTRDLVKFIGAAIASQVEIIAAISLLDKPDLTWENEAADRLHDKLRHNLEIPERHKALEAKLSTIRESLSTLMDLAQTRRMLALEASVVALIVLELVVSLLKIH